jgi:hypothetical protein
MNNFNFFSWLRDGVRQSVLLGVNDAVEQLGTPTVEEELHPSLAGFIQLNRSDSDTPKVTGRSKSTSSRKRLGKSLKDLDAGSAK